MKKFIPKVTGGVPVPGEYVLADATVLDVINPMVPVESKEALIGRAVAYFALGWLLAR